MSEWQPDWTTLNATASSFIESTPLSARIKTVTPVGGHVAIGLQMDLAQILTDAGASDHPLTGDLVIAVDTLTIPAGDTAIAAPTMEIVARALQVADGGNATLHLRSDSPAGLQVTTASIAGSIGVRLEASDGTPIGDGAGPTLQLSGLKTPQVLTVTGDAPTSVSTSTATDDVADTLHAPWSILALQLSSAIASVLVDEQTDEAMSLAADMLRWVTGGCYALIAERAAYTTVDYDEITSLQNASIGLLALTQASASGATYVPVLAADVYQTEVNALLGVAWTYDQKISDLADQSKVEQLLANLAQTLKSINQSAETPLFNTLRRLNDDSASVENQLTNAAVQLQQVGATLEPLQEALVDAINDEFQKKLLESALETFFTVLNLYVGAAAVILGDPEILAGSADKMIKAAIDIAKEVIEAGEKGIDAAISAGASPAGDPPIDADAQRAMDGAQYLAGSIASFGSAVSSLWAVVNAATSGGHGKINMTPDLLSTVEKLPDLSGFSVAGLDPVTYWDTVVVKTQAFVQPHQQMSQATAYLEAVELAATFGKAVGDLQMKLLDLYTQGMAAFDQLRSVYQAEEQWANLQSSLETQQDQIKAATGLLQRGYLAVKRNLVIAVENYRAAFAYQWLQPSGVKIDVSMDFGNLKQAAADSITSLQRVLAGTSDSTVRPRQTFQDVTYIVQQGDVPLFTEVDGQDQARWSITTDDTALADQLSGNTALFLTDATFELQGGTQSGEVELQVSNSGHYANKLGTASYRFVSSPVTMSSDYQPGPPPDFITSWSFADEAAYLKPTPYTNWTLVVNRGNVKDVSAIKMTLAGIMLQNPPPTT